MLSYALFSLLLHGFVAGFIWFLWDPYAAAGYAAIAVVWTVAILRRQQRRGLPD